MRRVTRLPLRVADHQGVAAAQAGFGMLGIALVLFVLSAVFALVWPRWQHALRDSRARATAAALKQFDARFEKYASEHGDWPAGTPVPGAYPPGMERSLANTPWGKPTPIGGRYVWLTNTYEHGERMRACIAIVSVPGDRVSDDQRQLTALDHAVDDGNFRVGRLRLGFRNRPVYVLEH
ncbi:MAG TPA: type II secretion system protein [Opitutaceae bacterium]|nr:type II secretion system protein [Opitutaceae bacterium]